MGSHVHQIVEQDENGNDIVKFYFGPNSNPPSAATIDGIGGDEYYLYKSSNNDYVLPINFSFINNTDTKYSHVYGTYPNDIVLNVNNGELISVPVDTTGKVAKAVEVKLYKRTYNKDRYTIEKITKAHVYCTLPIIKDDITGNFVFDTSVISDGNKDVFQFDEETKKYSVSSTINEGLQLELSDIVINQNADAEAGFIPGFAQLKANININTFGATDNTALGEMGSYSLGFIVNGKEIETTEDFFIYGETGSFTAPAISVTYEPVSTKWVSGLQYDSSAKMILEVTGIKNTQPQFTKDLNRLNLSWAGTDATTSTTLDTAPISKTNAYMSLANGTDTLSNAAEFSYNRETEVTTSTDVGKFNKSVTAKLYGRCGSIMSNVASTDGDISLSWLWTHTKGTESASTITFNNDGSEKWLRKLGTWDITNKKLITSALTDEFSSDTKDCLNDTTTSYKDELLIQGGWLKHPAKDKTGTYSSLTNERCFVRRIQLPNKSGQTGANQIGKIEINITNFD